MLKESTLNKCSYEFTTEMLKFIQKLDNVKYYIIDGKIYYDTHTVNQNCNELKFLDELNKRMCD